MTNQFIFAIPSFARADNQPCAKLLAALGYPKEQIVLHVQTANDFVEYCRRYSSIATVLYKPGACIGDNKNALLDATTGRGKTIVMLSDAVKGFLRYDEKTKSAKRVTTKPDFEFLLNDMYSVMMVERALIAGVYPVNNAFFMANSYVVGNIIIGCFMMIDPKCPLRFDPRLKVKEDFGLSLQAISRGARVVRLNYVTIDRTHKIKGGCKQWWDQKGDTANKAACDILLRSYGSLIATHRTRKNELRYIGSKRVVAIQ